MSTYDALIDGTDDLDQINLQIHRQEKAASQFLRSLVIPENNVPTNQVTFDRLKAGTVGKLTTIVKDGDPQPPGTQKVWSGVMLVSNNQTAVTGYRAP